MKTFSRLFGLVAVTALFICATSVAAAELDGTEWQVDITPEGATIPHHVDRVRFENGNFVSVIFERRGFQPTTYNSTGAADAATWEVAQGDDTVGRLAWKGQIEGEKLTGTLMWTQPDGTVQQNALLGRPAPPLEQPAGTGEATATTAGGEKAATKTGGWFGGCGLQPGK